MPHAEVASLGAVLVTLELVVELAEVLVAQRHTHLVAPGRSTWSLCAVPVIRELA